MGAKVFKSFDGKFMTAEEGHIHFLSERTGKSKMHVEEHDGGKKVSLKTHNGHYVAVNSNREIYIAHKHSGDECKFHLENHHGKVALKSHHGGYLGVSEEDRLRVNHERSERELFEEFEA